MVHSGVSQWHEKLESFFRGRDRALARIQAAIERVEEIATNVDDAAPADQLGSAAVEPSLEIFIVHGHDEAAKYEVARVIDRAGLAPVILHEQPNQGRTIIEKFEDHGSAVGFAVAIFSPDDVGGSDKDHLQPRARQNVVGEFFWFAGNMGRRRVCALVKGNVEMPSDFAGVLPIEMDAHGLWKSKLLTELDAAGYKDLRWKQALA
jgi:predicted nucleotide-binding protein